LFVFNFAVPLSHLLFHYNIPKRNLSEIMETGIQEVAGILARLKSLFWLLLLIKFGYTGSQIIFSCTGKRQRIQEKEFCSEAFSHAI